MRRGVWLLVFGVLVAALGAASAYAAGSATTPATTTTSTTGTTTTTTTPTTTTATTTTTPATTTRTTTTRTTTTRTTTTTHTTTTHTTATTPAAPAYSGLPASYLPGGCVGAGAAAIAVPGRRVLTLGTPASSRGPSAYPTRTPIIGFLSAISGSSSCRAAQVALGSVSLFGGAVTARSVVATHGRGPVSGVEIYGSPVTFAAGHPLRVGGWGQVTIQKTVGRLTAPLVLQLVEAHRGLPAGTTIAVAFGASPEAANRTTTHQSSGSPSSQQDARQGSKQPQLSSKPPPDFPVSPDPLLAGGGLTPGAQENGVVSIALHYLGIPYKWAGASPKTGFDCSGLVTYVFAKAGIALPHYAAAQYYSPAAVWVAPNRLEPGDLVFFVGSDGTRKMPGHVGIYVDDGYFIDAPHTGTRVRIDSLTEPGFANQYVAAKRIVGASFKARHLLHATGDAPSGPALPLILARRSNRQPFVESLPLIAVDRTAAYTSPPGAYGLWTVVALSSVLFVLGAGRVTYRLRRRCADSQAS